MKPIRLSGHARENIKYRGATEDEVIDAIHNAPWGSAEQGRLGCRKNFTYGNEWNGKFYTTKQVRPIFIEELNEIVIVTVYVYYL